MLPPTSSSSPSEALSPEPNKLQAMAVEVFILTEEYEVRGLVHVKRGVRPDRRLSELLNQTSRRFLAVTDAQLLSRQGGPTTPQHYAFIELHLDSILMLHPTAQSVMQYSPHDPTRHQRIQSFREKLL